MRIYHKRTGSTFCWNSNFDKCFVFARGLLNEHVVHKSTRASTFSPGTCALDLAFAWCLACLDVYHPFAALLVRAVTVSHASCPCAPSSNLSIPPHHTLCILHKMCISRAALSPAHAPRTCSVALLNTHHTRISASNSPQPRIPANENAQEREGERGRDGTPLHTKSEPNPTQTATTQVGENGKGGHISYSPATWLMWVFVSVGVQLVSSPTVCSRICWLHFPGIRENSLIFGRATSRALELEVQYSESRRYPGIIGGDQCD